MNDLFCIFFFFNQIFFYYVYSYNEHKTYTQPMYLLSNHNKHKFISNIYNVHKKTKHNILLMSSYPQPTVQVFTLLYLGIHIYQT